MATAQDLINQYYSAANVAYQKNIKREKETEAIYDKIIAMYGEGGTYGAGYLKQLETQKVQDVGGMSQRAISSGLYGLRDLGAEWEATVGETARLKLEDIKMERLSSALAAKAGFLSSISDTYPDYASLQEALKAISSVPSWSNIPSALEGESWSTGGIPATPATGEAGGYGAMPGGGVTIPMAQGYGPAYGTTGGTTDTTALQTTAALAGQMAGYPTVYTGGTTTAAKKQVDYLRDFNTFAAYKAAAEGAGLKAGTEAEWIAARKRIGLGGGTATTATSSPYLAPTGTIG